MMILELYEGTLFECQMIKNMLDNDGINSVLKDEAIGSRSHAWVPTSSVKVMISEQSLEQAKKVIALFETSRKLEE